MFKNKKLVVRLVGSALVSSAVTFGAIGVARALEVPRGTVASPDIYKIIAQSDKYVVIEATWKPGQRDEFHSSPGGGAYFLTTCRMMRHSPNGLTWSFTDPAGAAFVIPPVASVSVENVSDSECKMLLFQEK